MHYITLHPQVIVSRCPAAAALVRNDFPAFVDNKTFVVGCSQPPLTFSSFVFLSFPLYFLCIWICIHILICICRYICICSYVFICFCICFCICISYNPLIYGNRRWGEYLNVSKWKGVLSLSLTWRSWRNIVWQLISTSCQSSIYMQHVEFKSNLGLEIWWNINSA